ncbi:MAG: TadE/TadG family type IV pilus assembly protein [Pseudomonadota bacterium]
MIFALALIPIFSVAGFAIDHSRHISAQKQVQASLDAAALSTALRLSEEKLDPTSLDPVAQSFFDAQLETTSAMAMQPVKAKVVDDEVILSTTGTLDTTLMSIIGQNYMPLSAETAVVYNIQQPVELALVVDTSGSMSGSKLTALKDASYSLIDILLPSEDDPSKNDAAKMSIVPFNTYVKIDTKYKNASWMRDTAPYTRTWQSCKTTNRDRRDAGCWQESYSCTKWRGSVEQGNRQSYRGTCKRWKCPPGANPKKTCTPRSEYRQWHGCVRSRKNPYNVQDDTYGSQKIRGIVQKNACSTSQTAELSNDHEAVDKIISGLKANSNTYIPTGLIWGLRSLSSQEPFTGGEDYTAFAGQGGRKALMLMSDGANTVSPNNSGWHNKSNVSQANGYTLDVCQAAKDEGIEVYTIAFDLDDVATKQMLKDCATDDSYYYDADDADDLKAAFDSIGKDLAELAIAR